MSGSSLDGINISRSQYWLINALRYRLSKLFPGRRDPDLWVFSSWGGRKYADNSKYLYEYLLENVSGIRCVWQTSDPAVFRQLKEAGRPVELIGTPEAEETQKRAGTALFTNGLDDFGRYPHIYGAKTVALWHGTGYKKVYRALESCGDGQRKRRFSHLKWAFFSWIARDISIVPSEYSKEIMKEYAGLESDKGIVICGQPRNDVFGKNVTIDEAFPDEEVRKAVAGKKIILYMPTYRDDNSEMRRYVEEVFASEKLRRMLVDSGHILLAKLHPLNSFELPQNEAMMMIDERSCAGSYEAMAVSSALITDYSSCCADFALTGRPILFYFPDWDEYGADTAMLPGTRKECGINCAFSIEELTERVGRLIEDPADGLEQSRFLRERFDETGVRPGEYSKQCFETVRAALKEMSK